MFYRIQTSSAVPYCYETPCPREAARRILADMSNDDIRAACPEYLLAFYGIDEDDATTPLPARDQIIADFADEIAAMRSGDMFIEQFCVIQAI